MTQTHAMLLAHCVVFFCIYHAALSQQTSPITETITKSDLNRFKVLAESSLSQAVKAVDLPSLFYASSVLKSVTSTGTPSSSKAAVCDAVKTKVASTVAASATANQLQNVYYIAGINKALSCGISAKEFETALKAVEDEKVKIQDRFYGIHAATDFGITSPSVFNPDNVLKIVANQLSSSMDAPVAAQVYGVHMASTLQTKKGASEAAAGSSPSSAEHLNSMFSLIEDIVGQADEINEKYLQLEGGLGVTSLFIEGAFNLAAKMNKSPLIPQPKLQQLATYVLSRRDSQNMKTIYFVLMAAQTLSNNKHFVPVTVVLNSPKSISSSASAAQKVQFKVSNMMGGLVGGIGAVTADQVSRLSDGAIIVNKQTLTPSTADKTVYELDLLKLKPTPGFYTIYISVAPSAVNAVGVAKPVGIAPGKAKLELKVTSEVSVTNMNIAVIDAETTSTMGKQNSVVYPNSLKSTLWADASQKVLATFSVKDKASNLDLEAHQVFMRLVHVESQQEVFFVCELKKTTGNGVGVSSANSNQYEFEMKLKPSENIFKSLSGDYEMHLIVGDAVITNPLMWMVARVNLAFSNDVTASSKPPVPSYMTEYQPKPEIHHMFRKADPRPSVIFSQVFAFLAFLPLLVLLAVWSKLGVNVSNMQFNDLPTIGFHLGLAAIFGLYYFCWLRLNMFQTIKYLAVLGAITFFCGHKLLKSLALARINNSRVTGG